MKRSPLLVAVLLILIGTTPVQSQDSLYTLTAYVGVGFTRNFSEFAAPVQGLDQNGFTGSIRVMWKPEHLLRVGLEVARTHIFTVKHEGGTEPGSISGRASLYAWPILIVFSMSPWRNLDLSVGSGPGISVSDVELDGTESEASALGATYMASVAYLAPLAENLRLGLELKYYHINKSNDNNIVLQVTFGWKFLEW